MSEPVSYTQLGGPYTISEVPAKDTVLYYGDFVADSLNNTAIKPLIKVRLIAGGFNGSEVHPPQQVQKVEIRPSILTYKSNPGHFEPMQRKVVDNDWATGLFILSIVLLVWVRVFYARRIRQVFKAVFARYNVNQLVRDGNLPTEKLTPAIGFIYLFSLSILLYKLRGQFTFSWLNNEVNIVPFLFIISGVLGLWLFKLLLIRLTGWIFRSRQEAGELILTNLIFNLATGLIIFPLVLAGFYTGEVIVLKVALGIVLLAIAFRFVRSLMAGMAVQTFSVLHLFLYLCTLEILPVVFLIRLASIID